MLKGEPMIDFSALLPFTVIMLLVFFASLLVGRKKKRSKLDNVFTAQPYLLTQIEQQFQSVLNEILDPRLYKVHNQVSLMALVKPSAFNRIGATASKRLDYVITDHESKILAAIELDDFSHRRKDRQKRDQFLNEAMSGAHPLIRIKASKRYDVHHIASKLRENNIEC